MFRLPFGFADPSSARHPQRTHEARAQFEKHADALGAVHARVLRPGLDEEEYHRARTGAFSYLDCGYPLAIVQPESADEVAQAVRVLSGVPGLHVMVAGGKLSSMCLLDSACVIDLERLDHVVVNAEEGFVDVGGGARVTQVERALGNSGWGVITGFHGDAGMAGLALSGGVGFLSRAYGLLMDSILEAEVVLSGTGEVVVCRDGASERHASLLRGLRGGGGTLGIVTRIRLRLHDVSAAIYGRVTRLCPTEHSLCTVLREYRDLNARMLFGAEGCKNDFVSSAIQLNCASAFVPIFGMAIGPEVREVAQASQVEYLHKLGGAGISGHWMITRNDLALAEYHDANDMVVRATHTREFRMTSGMLIRQELSDDMIDVLVRYVRSEYPNRSSSISLFPLGGRIGPRGESPDRPDCFPLRHARYWVLMQSVCSDLSATETLVHKDWMRFCREELRGLDGPPSQAELHRVDTEKRVFLGDVKQTYDADNFFHMCRGMLLFG